MNTDELNAQRQRAMERMRQIQEQNARLVRERAVERKDEKDLKDLKGLKEERKSPFDTDKYCSGTTKQTFAGESMSTNSDIVLLVDPLTDKNNVLYYCFTAEELFQSFVSSRRLWKWNRGAVLTEPIFKIPIEFGRYIDYHTFKLIVRDKYNTILLTSYEDIPVGSSFGVSQLHGSKERVFTGVPIRQESAFRDYEVDGFTEEDKVKFKMDEKKVIIDSQNEQKEFIQLLHQFVVEDDVRSNIRQGYVRIISHNHAVIHNMTLERINDWIDNNRAVWNQIKKLECEYNQLETLPPLPPNLEILVCDDNKLTALPEHLPESLTVLYCDRNALTSLPTLPESLVKLRCGNNELSALPEHLPESLTVLYCYYNKLSSLPALPTSLKQMTCDNNKLRALPTLPEGLTELLCINNRIRALPETLPQSLEILECTKNKLRALPPLPRNLKELICDDNKLTTLPVLPEGLVMLNCDNNQLSSLPAIIPDSVEELSCENNPDLVVPDDVRERFRIR